MQAVKILQSSELEYFSIEYVSFHVTFNVYVQRACLKERELLKKGNDHQSKQPLFSLLQVSELSRKKVDMGNK